jgi:AraC-like DNA-binding protein
MRTSVEFERPVPPERTTPPERITASERATAIGEPVLRSRMAPVFLARLAERGAPLGQLLAEHGLGEEATRASDVSMPLDRFRALTGRIASLTGDPLLGVHAACALPPGTYGVVEFLMRSAPTPRDSLQQLLRFVPLFNNLLRVSLTDHGELATVELAIPGEPLCLGREGNEYTLAVFINIGRQLAAEGWSPEEVAFPHPRPTSASELDELTRFFGCRALTFGAGAMRLVFRALDLGIPVRTGDSALHSFLEREASSLAARTPVDDLDAAREAIRTALKTGEPSIGDVARALRTSGRTLQRRLHERDTSFRTLVGEVREGLAREYLQAGDRSLKEVASELGYADVRAFGRAFKRWTGRTPGS